MFDFHFADMDSNNRIINNIEGNINDEKTNMSNEELIEHL